MEITAKEMRVITGGVSGVDWLIVSSSTPKYPPKVSSAKWVFTYDNKLQSAHYINGKWYDTGANQKINNQLIGEEIKTPLLWFETIAIPTINRVLYKNNKEDI